MNGVGNGITEPWHGYRIGQICQMQAMDARYYFTVVARSHARAPANASESEFDVVSCASVMEAVQTMLSDHELLTECIPKTVLVFRIFPNLKRISSCSLYFAS